MAYGIYIRVSRLGDRTEDEATETYERQCREWLAREGLEAGPVVEDKDTSGSVAVAERGLEQLIAAVGARGA